MAFTTFSYRATLLAVLLLFASFTTYCNGATMEQKVVEFSGVQLRVAAVALEDFKKKGYPLEHYKVIMIKQPSGYEVIFVPDHPKGSPASRGGKTTFGEEIHYMVSSLGVIANITYGR